MLPTSSRQHCRHGLLAWAPVAKHMQKEWAPTSLQGSGESLNDAIVRLRVSTRRAGGGSSTWGVSADMVWPTLMRSLSPPGNLPTSCHAAPAAMQAARPPKSPGANGGSGMPPVPRPSSDSTLHPPPSGRPSSAPSGRSSFDSCVEGATSDPSRSQRASLESSYISGNATAVSPASAAEGGAAPAFHVAPELAAQCRLCGSGNGAACAPNEQCMHPSHSGSRSASFADLHQRPPSSLQQPPRQPSPFDSGSNLAQANSGSMGQQLSDTLSLPSPFSSSHSLVPPADGSGSRQRRHSTSKHPANLEHGSTAPPGAVDELVELLLQAATQANQANKAASSSGGANLRPPASARFAAPPRRSGHSAAAASPGSEPLLSSQVALLAQQLMLHQQQAGGGGGSQLCSERLPSWQGQGQRPLGRSRTVAAEELLAARGHSDLPSAAETLRLVGGGSGVQFGGGAGGALGGALDPACQPRFSAATSPPSEEASPFSSVQGE